MASEGDLLDIFGDNSAVEQNGLTSEDSPQNSTANDQILLAFDNDSSSANGNDITGIGYPDANHTLQFNDGAATENLLNFPGNINLPNQIAENSTNTSNTLDNLDFDVFNQHPIENTEAKNQVNPFESSLFDIHQSEVESGIESMLELFETADNTVKNIPDESNIDLLGGFFQTNVVQTDLLAPNEPKRIENEASEAKSASSAVDLLGIGSDTAVETDVLMDTSDFNSLHSDVIKDNITPSSQENEQVDVLKFTSLSDADSKTDDLAIVSVSSGAISTQHGDETNFNLLPSNSMTASTNNTTEGRSLLQIDEFSEMMDDDSLKPNSSLSQLLNSNLFITAESSQLPIFTANAEKEASGIIKTVNNNEENKATLTSKNGKPYGTSSDDEIVNENDSKAAISNENLFSLNMEIKTDVLVSSPIDFDNVTENQTSLDEETAKMPADSSILHSNQTLLDTLDIKSTDQESANNTSQKSIESENNPSFNMLGNVLGIEGDKAVTSDALTDESDFNSTQSDVIKDIMSPSSPNDKQVDVLNFTSMSISSEAPATQNENETDFNLLSPNSMTPMENNNATEGPSLSEMMDDDSLKASNSLVSNPDLFLTSESSELSIFTANAEQEASGMIKSVNNNEENKAMLTSKNEETCGIFSDEKIADGPKTTISNENLVSLNLKNETAVVDPNPSDFDTITVSQTSLREETAKTPAESSILHSNQTLLDTLDIKSTDQEFANNTSQKFIESANNPSFNMLGNVLGIEGDKAVTSDALIDESDFNPTQIDIVKDNMSPSSPNNKQVDVLNFTSMSIPSEASATPHENETDFNLLSPNSMSPMENNNATEGPSLSEMMDDDSLKTSNSSVSNPDLFLTSESSELFIFTANAEQEASGMIKNVNNNEENKAMLTSNNEETCSIFGDEKIPDGPKTTISNENLVSLNVKNETAVVDSSPTDFDNSVVNRSDLSEETAKQSADKSTPHSNRTLLDTLDIKSTDQECANNISQKSLESDNNPSFNMLDNVLGIEGDTAVTSDELMDESDFNSTQSDVVKDDTGPSSPNNKQVFVLDFTSMSISSEAPATQHENESDFNLMSPNSETPLENTNATKGQSLSAMMDDSKKGNTSSVSNPDIFPTSESSELSIFTASAEQEASRILKSVNNDEENKAMFTSKNEEACNIVKDEKIADDPETTISNGNLFSLNLDNETAVVDSSPTDFDNVVVNRSDLGEENAKQSADKSAPHSNQTLLDTLDIKSTDQKCTSNTSQKSLESEDNLTFDNVLGIESNIAVTSDARMDGSDFNSDIVRDKTSPSSQNIEQHENESDFNLLPPNLMTPLENSNATEGQSLSEIMGADSLKASNSLVSNSDLFPTSESSELSIFTANAEQEASGMIKSVNNNEENKAMLTSKNEEKLSIFSDDKIADDPKTTIPNENSVSLNVGNKTVAVDSSPTNFDNVIVNQTDLGEETAKQSADISTFHPNKTSLDTLDIKSTDQESSTMETSQKSSEVENNPSFMMLTNVLIDADVREDLLFTSTSELTKTEQTSDNEFLFSQENSVDYSGNHVSLIQDSDGTPKGLNNSDLFLTASSGENLLNLCTEPTGVDESGNHGFTDKQENTEGMVEKTGISENEEKADVLPNLVNDTLLSSMEQELDSDSFIIEKNLSISAPMTSNHQKDNKISTNDLEVEGSSSSAVNEPLIPVTADHKNLEISYENINPELHKSEIDELNAASDAISDSQSILNLSSPSETPIEYSQALLETVDNLLESVFIEVGKEISEYSDAMELDKNNITETDDNQEENMRAVIGPQVETSLFETNKPVCDDMNSIIDPMISDDGVPFASSGTSQLNNDGLLTTNEAESKQDNDADISYMFDLTTGFEQSVEPVQNSSGGEVNDILLPIGQQSEFAISNSSLTSDIILPSEGEKCNMSTITTNFSESLLELSDSHVLNGTMLPQGQNMNSDEMTSPHAENTTDQSINIHSQFDIANYTHTSEKCLSTKDTEKSSSEVSYDQNFDFNKHSNLQTSFGPSLEQHIFEDTARGSSTEESLEILSNDFELFSPEEILIAKQKSSVQDYMLESANESIISESKSPGCNDNDSAIVPNSKNSSQAMKEIAIDIIDSVGKSDEKTISEDGENSEVKSELLINDFSHVQENVSSKSNADDSILDSVSRDVDTLPPDSSQNKNEQDRLGEELMVIGISTELNGDDDFVNQFDDNNNFNNEEAYITHETESLETESTSVDVSTMLELKTEIFDISTCDTFDSQSKNDATTDAKNIHVRDTSDFHASIPASLSEEKVQQTPPERSEADYIDCSDINAEERNLFIHSEVNTVGHDQSIMLSDQNKEDSENHSNSQDDKPSIDLIMQVGNEVTIQGSEKNSNSANMDIFGSLGTISTNEVSSTSPAGNLIEEAESANVSEESSNGENVDVSTTLESKTEILEVSSSDTFNSQSKNSTMDTGSENVLVEDIPDKNMSIPKSLLLGKLPQTQSERSKAEYTCGTVPKVVVSLASPVEDLIEGVESGNISESSFNGENPDEAEDYSIDQILEQNITDQSPDNSFVSQESSINDEPEKSTQGNTVPNTSNSESCFKNNNSMKGLQDDSNADYSNSEGVVTLPYAIENLLEETDITNTNTAPVAPRRKKKKDKVDDSNPGDIGQQDTAQCDENSTESNMSDIISAERIDDTVSKENQNQVVDSVTKDCYSEENAFVKHTEHESSDTNEGIIEGINNSFQIINQENMINSEDLVASEAEDLMIENSSVQFINDSPRDSEDLKPNDEDQSELVPKFQVEDCIVNIAKPTIVTADIEATDCILETTYDQSFGSDITINLEKDFTERHMTEKSDKNYHEISKSNDDIFTETEFDSKQNDSSENASQHQITGNDNDSLQDQQQQRSPDQDSIGSSLPLELPTVINQISDMADFADKEKSDDMVKDNLMDDRSPEINMSNSLMQISEQEQFIVTTQEIPSPATHEIQPITSINEQQMNSEESFMTGDRGTYPDGILLPDTTTGVNIETTDPVLHTESGKDILIMDSDESMTTTSEASFSIHSGEMNNEDQIDDETNSPIIDVQMDEENSFETKNASDTISEKLVSELLTSDTFETVALQKTKDSNDGSNFNSLFEDNGSLLADIQNNSICDKSDALLIIDSNTPKECEEVKLDSFINDESSELKVDTEKYHDTCSQVPDQYSEVVMQPDSNYIPVIDCLNVEDTMQLSLSIADEENEESNHVGDPLKNSEMLKFSDIASERSTTLSHSDETSTSEKVVLEKNSSNGLQKPILEKASENQSVDNIDIIEPVRHSIEEKSTEEIGLVETGVTGQIFHQIISDPTLDKSSVVLEYSTKDVPDTVHDESQSESCFGNENLLKGIHDESNDEKDHTINELYKYQILPADDHTEHSEIIDVDSNVTSKNGSSVNFRQKEDGLETIQDCSNTVASSHNNVAKLGVNITELAPSDADIDITDINEVDVIDGTSKEEIVGKEHDQVINVDASCEEVESTLQLIEPAAATRDSNILPPDHIVSPTMEFDDDMFGDTELESRISIASNVIKKTPSLPSHRTTVSNTYVSGQSYSSAVPSSVYIDNDLLSDDEGDVASIEANATSSDDEHNDDSETDDDMFHGQDDFDDPIIALRHQVSQNNSVPLSSYVQSGPEDSNFTYRGFDAGWEEIAEEEHPIYSNLPIIMEETEPSDTDEPTSLNHSAEESEDKNGHSIAQEFEILQEWESNTTEPTSIVNSKTEHTGVFETSTEELQKGVPTITISQPASLDDMDMIEHSNSILSTNANAEESGKQANEVIIPSSDTEKEVATELDTEREVSLQSSAEITHENVFIVDSIPTDNELLDEQAKGDSNLKNDELNQPLVADMDLSDGIEIANTEKYSDTEIHSTLLEHQIADSNLISEPSDNQNVEKSISNDFSPTNAEISEHSVIHTNRHEDNIPPPPPTRKKKKLLLNEVEHNVDIISESAPQIDDSIVTGGTPPFSSIISQSNEEQDQAIHAAPISIPEPPFLEDQPISDTTKSEIPDKLTVDSLSNATIELDKPAMEGELSVPTSVRDEISENVINKDTLHADVQLSGEQEKSAMDSSFEIYAQSHIESNVVVNTEVSMESCTGIGTLQMEDKTESLYDSTNRNPMGKDSVVEIQSNSLIPQAAENIFAKTFHETDDSRESCAIAHSPDIDKSPQESLIDTDEHNQNYPPPPPSRKKKRTLKSDIEQAVEETVISQHESDLKPKKRIAPLPPSNHSIDNDFVDNQPFNANDSEKDVLDRQVIESHLVANDQITSRDRSEVPADLQASQDENILQNHTRSQTGEINDGVKPRKRIAPMPPTQHTYLNTDNTMDDRIHAIGNTSAVSKSDEITPIAQNVEASSNSNINVENAGVDRMEIQSEIPEKTDDDSEVGKALLPGAKVTVIEDGVKPRKRIAPMPPTQHTYLNTVDTTDNNTHAIDNTAAVSESNKITPIAQNVEASIDSIMNVENAGVDHMKIQFDITEKSDDDSEVGEAVLFGATVTDIEDGVMPRKKIAPMPPTQDTYLITENTVDNMVDTTEDVSSVSKSETTITPLQSNAETSNSIVDADVDHVKIHSDIIQNSDQDSDIEEALLFGATVTGMTKIMEPESVDTKSEEMTHVEEITEQIESEEPKKSILDSAVKDNMASSNHDLDSTASKDTNEIIEKNLLETHGLSDSDSEHTQDLLKDMSSSDENLHANDDRKLLSSNVDIHANEKPEQPVQDSLMESYHSMAFAIVDQLVEEVITMGKEQTVAESTLESLISVENVSNTDPFNFAQEDDQDLKPEMEPRHDIEPPNLIDADITFVNLDATHDSFEAKANESLETEVFEDNSNEGHLVQLVALNDAESKPEQSNQSHRIRYETTGSVGSLTFLTDSEEDDDANIKQKQEQLISLDDDAVVDDDDDDIIEPMINDFSNEIHSPGKRKSLVPPSSLILSVALDDTPDAAQFVDTPVEQITIDLATSMSENISQRSSSFIGSETSATSSIDDVTGKRSSLPRLPSLRKEKPKTPPEPTIIKTNIQLVARKDIIPISPKPDVLRMIRWETVTIKNIEYKIDETAIQPYKKVISHGGFYDEKSAIIEIFTSYLPSSNIDHYAWVMDNLFLYVLATVELLARDKFSVVMFVGSTPKHQIPSNSLLKKWHEHVDYSLKKNVEAFYIMNPTLYFRTMARLFVSRKVMKKMKYVKNMSDLKTFIPTDFLFVPSEIAK
ncbi:uncharacterized protein LOC120341877 isoform X2 [Styela clava]